MFWLAGGAIASQAWILLTLPVLTALYAPAAFGVYALFFATYLLLSVPAGLRYDSAAVLPRLDRDAFACLVLAVASALVVVVLVFIAGAVAAARVPTLPTGEATRHLPAAMAVMIFAGAVQRAAIAWATRRSAFRLMGVSQFVLNVVTVALQVLLAGRLGSDGEAMIWGHAGALFIIGLAMAGLLLLNDSGRVVNPVSRLRLAAVARRYSRFPRYMVIYGLSSALRERIVLFMLGTFGSAAAAGTFAVASRFAGAPSSLVYAAFGPALYSFAARAGQERASAVARDLVKLTLLILAPAFGVLAGEAPLIVTTFLGTAWAETARVLQWIAAPMLLLAAVTWLDRLFDAALRQREALLLQLAYIASLGVLIPATILVAGESVAVPVYAVTTVLFVVAFGAAALSTRETSAIYFLSREVALALGVFAVAYLISMQLSTTLTLPARGTLYVVLYAGFAGLVWHARGRHALAALDVAAVATEKRGVR